MLGRDSDRWASIVFAVSLHVVIIAVLSVGWDMSIYRLPTERPPAITAELIALEPQNKPEPRRQQNRRPTPRAPVTNTQPEPVQAPPKPDLIEEPPEVDPEPIVEVPQSRQMEDDLLLDDLLESESDAFEALSDEEKKASQEATIRALFAQKVGRYWSRPPSARNGMEVVIRLQFVPSGEIAGLTIVSPSTDPAFDRSAVSAIRRGAPYDFVMQFGQDFFNERLRNTTFVFRPEDLK